MPDADGLCREGGERYRTGNRSHAYRGDGHEKKQMIGTMEVKYEILSSEIPKIILDLKGPEIVSIEYAVKNEKKENAKLIPLSYEIDSENQYKDSLGTPLIISLGNVEKNSPDEFKKLSQSKLLFLLIKFITTEKCTGIQFLTKE